MVREGLKCLLELDKAYNVVGEAGDGYECLDVVSKTNPDIIIMDIENIALREVPSIHSIRRNTSEDTVGYKVISELSEWAYFLSDNFELFIALAAAVIVPFKKYTEKINI